MGSSDTGLGQSDATTPPPFEESKAFMTPRKSARSSGCHRVPEPTQKHTNESAVRRYTS
jgi:hypothetical protein